MCFRLSPINLLSCTYLSGRKTLVVCWFGRPESENLLDSPSGLAGTKFRRHGFNGMVPAFGREGLFVFRRHPEGDRAS